MPPGLSCGPAPAGRPVKGAVDVGGNVAERIEVIEDFPLTRVGKLDKLALKAAITETLKREAVSPPDADRGGARS